MSEKIDTSDIPEAGQEFGGGPHHAVGISMRDYFAAQALMGALAAIGVPADEASGTAIARACYKLANAMIAERR